MYATLELERIGGCAKAQLASDLCETSPRHVAIDQLQRCRALLAILVAALNKTPYRQEQSLLATFSDQLWQTIKILRRMSAVDEGLLELAQILMATINELKSLIASKSDIRDKIAILNGICCRISRGANWADV